MEANIIKREFTDKSKWYVFDVEEEIAEQVLEVVSPTDTVFNSVRTTVEASSSSATTTEESKGGILEMLKGLAKDLLKEVLNSSNKEESSSEPKSPYDGKFSYTVINDNTDDEVEMDQLLQDGKIWSIVYPIGKDLYKEVWFTKTERGHKIDSSSMVKKVFVIGKNRKTAEDKAKSLMFSEEITKCFKPDYNTGRTFHPVIDFDSYSGRNLRINPKIGDLDFLQTTVYYLPNKTVEGRNIQFNWGSLSVNLIKDGKKVGSISPKKGHRGGRWVENAKNTFDNATFIERLSPGKYQLEYKIYDETPFYKVEFEVYKVKNPDVNHELSEIFNLKSPENKYLQIIIDHNKVEADAKVNFVFSYQRLLDFIEQGKKEVLLQARLYKNGKLYGLTNEVHDTSLDHKAPKDVALKLCGAQVELLHHYNKPNASFGFKEIKDSTMNDWKELRRLEDAKYRVEWLVDDELFAEASFEVKAGDVVRVGNQVNSKKNITQFLMSSEEKIAFVPISYHQ